VCLASEPDSIDPALNSTVDGATLISHLFAGLAKWSQNENGELILLPDCAAELPEGVTNPDGTVTYTYTLRDNLKWSDGREAVAEDFVYAWNRAAGDDTGHGYLFEVIQGYETGKLAVSAPDDKTLIVTLNNPIGYFHELLALPAYMPVRKDIVENQEGWATGPATYICNGAYTLTRWQHDSVITMNKNPNYYDAESVTMEEIRFYLSDDANNMLSNFKNGTWLVIEHVPTNEIAALKQQYPQEFVIAPQIGTYYLSWNINADLSPIS
jgi:oligopeptide transport system substrate-binding protein